MDGESFFSPWETPVSSWAEAQNEIDGIMQRAGARVLAWRGVTDARWSLHSALYRRLMAEKPTPLPDETDLVQREKQLLEVARSEWRFDDRPALEILAQLQHYGGPTRMLDVTFNPHVALWFAVEAKFGSSGKPLDDCDGRLFAFDVTGREATLKTGWDGRELPWHANSVAKWRSELPLIWRPPAYNERIAAQDSAFLLAGVPRLPAGGNAQYRQRPGARSPFWKTDQIRAATSVPLRMNVTTRKPNEGSQPTFTLRIKVSGKTEIRSRLEKNFGYKRSSIYPDLFGMATELAKSHR